MWVYVTRRARQLADAQYDSLSRRPVNIDEGKVRLDYECSTVVVALQATHCRYWLLRLGKERHVGSEPMISSLIKPRGR